MINFFLSKLNTLNIFNQVKLYYIFCLILILLFLILMEIINKYGPNKNQYLESGFTINKNIFRFMSIMGGIGSVGSFIVNKNKKDLTELSNNLNKESDKIKKEIFDLEESHSETKTSVLANLQSLKERIVEMKTQVDKAKEIMKKKKETESITKEEINSNSDLQYYLAQIEVNWNKVVNYSKEGFATYGCMLRRAEKELNKKNFLPGSASQSANFNISELYKNITNDQLGGIGLLLFSQVIIASAISIIFIFFGEYLIQRFDLENKYPKLAKFIQLRRKFQRYYLILNIFYIILIGIVLGIFGIWLYFT